MSDTSAALSGLTTAINDVRARVDEDVAHLQSLLEQALAASADDEAEAQRLREEIAGVVGHINEATSSLASIDPVADFPGTPTPEGPEDPAEPEPTPEGEVTPESQA